jgi:hypothetical protein
MRGKIFRDYIEGKLTHQEASALLELVLLGEKYERDMSEYIDEEERRNEDG